MSDVIVVIGAESIGQAIARRQRQPQRLVLLHHSLAGGRERRVGALGDLYTVRRLRRYLGGRFVDTLIWI
jgi:hypothetical protein